MRRIFFSRTFSVLCLVLTILASGIVDGGIQVPSLLEKLSLAWRSLAHFLLLPLDKIQFFDWHFTDAEKDILLLCMVIAIPLLTSSMVYARVLGVLFLLQMVASAGVFDNSLARLVDEDGTQTSRRILQWLDIDYAPQTEWIVRLVIAAPVFAVYGIIVVIFGTFPKYRLRDHDFAAGLRAAASFFSTAFYALLVLLALSLTGIARFTF